MSDFDRRVEAEGVVRAVLMALRNPSAELCEVGVKYMPGPSWSSALGLAFTAMIDHILSEA